MRPDHAPQGNPCQRCGVLAVRHRVYHKPQGEPCLFCGLPKACHRTTFAESTVLKRRTRQRKAYVPRTPSGLTLDLPHAKRKGEPVYMGIDGEGQGRLNHHYVYLACSDTTGAYQFAVEDQGGLPTARCLDFLLALGRSHIRCFAFAFQYDLTKILTDVPSKDLYLLFRPNLRARKKEPWRGPHWVHWKGYQLNLQGTKFGIRRGDDRVTVWDIFKFYQSKFVSAIKEWKVGSPALWDRMQKMKDQRDEFDKLDFEAVRHYCLEECMCMAQLAQKLDQAHEAAGLKLTSYYGAGSSASAMLKTMGIREALKKVPEELNRPVAAAFFGGRFENSRLGPVTERCWNYDISSAYPYQCMFLPCLLHGSWKFTKQRKDLDDAKTAIVHYGLEMSATQSDGAAWGPYPFREDDGSICFPTASGGGWIYKDEYIVGERYFSGVRFRGAWIYTQECAHQPFEKLATYYCERLRIGKEGPGIVLKLGCNSCYGKIAQSVGNAPFNNWLWAGLITSGTRAQLLQLLCTAKDPWNVLMLATDGLVCRERLKTDLPRETGTGQAVTPDGKLAGKPLGGWEEKEMTKGIFLARPGIYFPMNPSEADLTSIRGRGVGKKTVLDNWQRILDAYQATDWSQEESVNRIVRVTNVSRFCGAKSSVHRSGEHGAYIYTRAAGKGKAPSYGQWIVRPVDMSFDPMPKRSGVLPDGRLAVRRLPEGQESTPYEKSLRSEDKTVLEASELELLEQPDVDLGDYQ